MGAKVEGMTEVVNGQQSHIEGLTERVIRLETALEIALMSQGSKSFNKRQADHRVQSM